MVFFIDVTVMFSGSSSIYCLAIHIVPFPRLVPSYSNNIEFDYHSPQLPMLVGGLLSSVNSESHLYQHTYHGLSLTFSASILFGLFPVKFV